MESEKDLTVAPPACLDYQIDHRPLCQGMPFVLTDAAHPRFVLKNGSHFIVLDRSGSIPACNTLGYGYYRYDTRHLSQWEITINGAPLSLLSADTSRGYTGTFLYTNTQTDNLAQQQLTLKRSIVLSDVLWDRMTLENFSKAPLSVSISLRFQSDFADMFEVRGLNRANRGTRMMPASDSAGRSIFLAYRGLDNVLVETIVKFSGVYPLNIEDGEAVFAVALPVRSPLALDISISTRLDEQPHPARPWSQAYETALQKSESEYQHWREGGASVTTGHEIFDLCLERGLRDIYILRQPTPKGWGLGAGIPWYCAVFGRDSAITSWQVLPFMPALARETIEILAAYQGTKKDSFRAERPGKIMHELRLGELARLGQIPHSPYYGSVDATPLWLIVLCQYVRWTGDLDFARRLWPAVKLALSYLDRACEGGYLSYRRESPQGLENQGWKDSGDSVCHSDGSLAMPPIAICEAQGYLYAARLAVADLAEQLSFRTMATRLRGQAEDLQRRFAQDFWMPAEGFLAMALDGQGRRVESVTSNPGHCLWSGILPDEKARLVADRLLSSDMNSGWGLRTLSQSMSNYNPISYHNGSVWPHDNSIILEGLRKLGRMDSVHQLMLAMLEAAQYQPDFRLPELYCGFPRAGSLRPIDYPVSCSPQAWAAGSFFQALIACLNFQPDALARTLRIVSPALPEWLGRVTIDRLRLAEAEVDLALNVENGYTFCQILRKTGNLKVIIEN